MKLSERLIWLASGALAAGTLCVLVYLLFGSCSAKAADFAPEGKDLNGIWEVSTLPDLDSCGEYMAWSTNQRKVYLEDYLKGKYERASRGFIRCLERYTDESAYYVYHQCNLMEDTVDNIVKDAERIVKIYCYERGRTRENPWRTGRP